MLQFFYDYCNAINQKAPLMFFAVGGFLLLTLLTDVLVNPYKKQIAQTQRAKNALKKCSKSNKRISVPMPAMYAHGWSIYQRSSDLLPSECLAFADKKPRFFFDIIALLGVALLMPFTLLARRTGIYDWRFFVPFAYMLAFLVSFQTHRLLFKKRTDRARQVHTQYVLLLDKLYEKGYYSPTPREMKAELLSKIHSQDESISKDIFPKHLNSGYVSNTPDLPEIQPLLHKNDIYDAKSYDDGLFDKIAFLTKNGLTEESAQSLCELLAKSQKSPSAEVQKQLNKLLNKTFYSVCQNNGKSA